MSRSRPTPCLSTDPKVTLATPLFCGNCGKTHSEVFILTGTHKSAYCPDTRLYIKHVSGKELGETKKETAPRVPTPDPGDKFYFATATRRDPECPLCVETAFIGIHGDPSLPGKVQASKAKGYRIDVESGIVGKEKPEGVGAK